MESWLLRVLALLGLGLSGFLLSVSLGQRAAPPGCGPGSPCGEVLGSRWSAVLDLPVSAPAMLVYLLAALALTQARATRPAENRAAAWSVLSLLAGALLAAALWFTLLQLAVIGQVCPWCMASHAIGLTLAIWLLRRISDGTRLPRRRWITLLSIGAAAVIAMAIAQVTRAPTPHRTPLPTPLPQPGQFDSGPGPQRTLVLLDGALVVPFEQSPRRGPADAELVLAVMLDYRCPHCRDLHHELMDLLSQHEQRMCMLSLPTPLEATCNPHLLETDPPFVGSCEVARLALAVWQAAPEQYATLEDWLFASPTPPSVAEVRAFAEGLVGSQNLLTALEDPAIDATLARHVQAYGHANLERLPVLLSPRAQPVLGPPDPEELRQWLMRQ